MGDCHPHRLFRELTYYYEFGYRVYGDREFAEMLNVIYSEFPREGVDTFLLGAEEIEKTGACEKAGRMADRLTAGINAAAKKYDLPFVIFNQGSICHVDTVGTMHFAIDWSKPWQLPGILKETSKRQKEMEHMGAAYMAEGIITLAGSRLYTSAAYNEEMIDDVIARFDRAFPKCGKLE
jgi:glutamate-1-semialdehyde 2,1-aminomutase